MVCAFCVLSKKSLTPRLQRYSLCFLYLVEPQIQKRLFVMTAQVSYSVGIFKNKGFIKGC